jgi:hypothetical protein
MDEGSKIFQLAKKLKALSDRGVGGEKENATQMLFALCRKHNIDISLLEGEQTKDHEFWLHDDPFERKFFTQVASSVIGDCNLILYKYKMGQRKPGMRRHGLCCTSSEFLEIMAKFDFFFKHYQKEVLLYYKAFVQKNKLYMKVDHTEENDTSDRELSATERAELWKIANMMEGIERKIFTKQLGNG